MWPGAAGQEQPEPASLLDVWIAVGAMAVIVAFGVWAIYRVKRWREESVEEAVDTPEQQFDDFQKMVDEGLLEPQELNRIKAKLEASAQPQLPGADIPPPSQPPDTSIREK